MSDLNDEDGTAACALVNKLVTTAIYRVTVPDARRSPQQRKAQVDKVRDEVVGHVAVALRAKRLSPAEYDVLTKPVFTRAFLSPLTPEEKKIAEGVVMESAFRDGGILGWTAIRHPRHDEPSCAKQKKPGDVSVSQDGLGRLTITLNGGKVHVEFCPHCGFKGASWET